MEGSQVPSCTLRIEQAEEIPLLIQTLYNKSEGVKVSTVAGGITNRIFKASCGSETWLVRIFGGEEVFSVEDRVKETEILEELGKNGHSPRLLGRFTNGRVEEWLEGRTITLDEMRSDNVMKGIAKALSRLHEFVPPTVDQRVELWERMKKWELQVEKLVEQNKTKDVGVRVEQVEKWIGESRSGFCHNDILAGNVLITKNESIRLVDFEYASWNCIAFDIGNYFCECMGGTEDGVVKVEKWPTLEQRQRFCEYYGGGDQLRQDAEKWSLVAHLYWGLWAVVQSESSSTIDFPYAHFAQQRLQLFLQGWKTYTNK